MVMTISPSLAEYTILFNMLCTGCILAVSVRSTSKSALLPSLIAPQSHLPCASAPFMVAASRACCGVTTVGFSSLTFAKIAKVFISSKKFRLLLLATLSVPSATGISRFSISVTLQIPLASFKLLTGLDATVTPFSFRISKSSPSHHTQCAAIVGTSKMPK